ncbi:UDP-phosphate galactose phosphotransferase, partial [[Clostridium] innocuum]|nr:UDP-phosphate galactose phosphotransferase [[Clostridium] innocuum]
MKSSVFLRFSVYINILYNTILVLFSISLKVYVLRFKIPFYKREGSEFINECKYMREKIGITACLLEEIVV